MKEVNSDIGFAYWLSKAKRGSRVMYYDGFLMMDKEKSIKNGGFPENFPSHIRAANMAWKAYKDGFVILVQKKKDACSYEYIAIKT